MFFPTLLIAFGLFLLTLGGEILLRGSVGLATRLQVSASVIGLTIVAAGTSIPELAVSAVASVHGKPDLSVANIIGSNIYNIAFIIGLCAVLRPIPIVSGTVKFEFPFLLGFTLLGILVIWDLTIGRIEGVVLFTAYAAFTVLLLRVANPRIGEVEKGRFESELQDLTENTGGMSIGIALVLIAFGISLLVGGARAAVIGAVQIAHLLGWSERVIGLTIVSAGTSLPEVFASLVSSLRGRSDIAIANIIGSNIFNLLVVLGVSAMFVPLQVQPSLITNDCSWMLGVTLLLFPLMRSGYVVNRWEGGVLLATYGIYLWRLLAVA